MNEVFFSIPVLGVNVVYTPQGKKYKVRIPRVERRNLPISSDLFVNISRSIFHTDVDVVFE